MGSANTVVSNILLVFTVIVEIVSTYQRQISDFCRRLKDADVEHYTDRPSLMLIPFDSYVLMKIHVSQNLNLTSYILIKGISD